MHDVKGHDIRFVSKRKGEVIPCTMSRGMTGFLSERKG